MILMIFFISTGRDLGKTVHAKPLSLIYTIPMETDSQVHCLLIRQRPLTSLIMTYFTGSSAGVESQISVIN